MLDHRMQLLLDSERYRKVSREAERRGVSVAAVIRDAIDRLPAAPETRQAAIEAVLRAAPMPVPADPRDLRRELDAVHARLDHRGRQRGGREKTRR